MKRLADKLAWECALLFAVRDEIKSGNVSVKNSKRFGPFDQFFIPDDQWQTMREEFFEQSGLPQRGQDAAHYFTERLALAYDRFLETLPSNTYAQVDGTRWHLSVDSAEPLDPIEEARLERLVERAVALPRLRSG